MNNKEQEALELAFTLHAGQLDKQGKPYILHVLRVAFACFIGATENVFIAALLHDTVEDCGLELREISVRFGERIATAVDHLSRRSRESYTAYIARLKNDAIAIRVKRADLNDNLLESRIGTLPEEDQQRLRRRYAKALKMFETPAPGQQEGAG